jgi:hypothetical protein
MRIKEKLLLWGGSAFDVKSFFTVRQALCRGRKRELWDRNPLLPRYAFHRRPL